MIPFSIQALTFTSIENYFEKMKTLLLVLLFLCVTTGQALDIQEIASVTPGSNQTSNWRGGRLPGFYTVRVSQNFVGSLQLSCPSDTPNLLSCGLNNLPTATQVEVYRHAIPVSSSTCDCYDYFGAVCVAQCTYGIQGFQISKTAGRAFDTSCPSGTKVLGCHIQPIDSTGIEVWREHYPSSDGSSCHCYDYFGANCYATCGSDIFDYEVVNSHGKGDVTVQCPSDKSALGCGINPDFQGPERWRAMYVSSQTSCTCHDSYGVTCYAICGNRFQYG
jgi:hypothetical protein